MAVFTLNIIILVTRMLKVKTSTHLCKGSEVMAELVKGIPGLFQNRVNAALVQGDGGGLERSR